MCDGRIPPEDSGLVRLRCHSWLTSPSFQFRWPKLVSWDPASAERSDQHRGARARDSGLRWTFCANARHRARPALGTNHGRRREDPFLGAAFAVHACADLKEPITVRRTKILACAKHWLLTGQLKAAGLQHHRHVGKHIARNILPPFKAAVDAGVGSVMSAFNDLKWRAGVSQSLHAHKRSCRGEWKFDGFVVSDYTSVKETNQSWPGCGRPGRGPAGTDRRR